MASVPLTGTLRGLDAKVSHSSVRFRTIQLCTTHSTTLFVVSELAECLYQAPQNLYVMSSVIYSILCYPG